MQLALLCMRAVCFDLPSAIFSSNTDVHLTRVL